MFLALNYGGIKRPKSMPAIVIRYRGITEYLDTASNGFYYQLEGNQGWKKKVDSDDDFAGTHHHYHSIPPAQGQKSMVTPVPLTPHPSYQPKARNQKAMNTNPPQSTLVLSIGDPFQYPVVLLCDYNLILPLHALSHLTPE
ncbi:hypothetical protein LOAG_00812 [Loa loa]|uniref:Uncharacterized protein n=1 Tax=Loa loa TaxID=7209 RepID=A0A1S0UAV5_LOALO|nr:hypothetical protein LOAG_00812 [Loa loa]EFO27659.1 hypothetical protein LOAG_00812 [Loa loa]